MKDIMRKLFDKVTVTAIVDDVAVKVTCKDVPESFAWDDSRTKIVASHSLSTSAVLDKDTEYERRFSGKDKSGKDIAPYIPKSDKPQANGNGKTSENRIAGVTA